MWPTKCPFLLLGLALPLFFFFWRVVFEKEKEEDAGEFFRIFLSTSNQLGEKAREEK